MRFRRMTAIAVSAVFVSTFAITAAAKTGDIEINEDSFPNEDFRSIVSRDDIDLNEDGFLSQDEIKQVTELDLSDFPDCKTLEGIEFFTELRELRCNSSGLTEIDVSLNTELEYLDCAYNPIKSLSVAKNTKLMKLYCEGTKIRD
ncbi:MAG: hypothetical protein IKH76_06795, partial [Clostridiales bacterium]|nr:hypothetical protein [Clostridiales bacterium]